MKQPIHISWLVGWFSAGIVSGIALSIMTTNPLPGYPGIIVALLCITIAISIRSRWVVLCMLAAGILLGMSRGGVIQSSLQSYEAYYGENVVVSGRVQEDVTIGSRGDKRVRITSVKIDSNQLPGQIWVSTSTLAEIKRGDHVSFEGLLNEGFGNIPASMFRATLTSHSYIKYSDAPREVRDWFAGGIRRAIQEPESSLGAGYLLGQHSALPEDLDTQLRLLGLTHVVVASGYNLTILVRFARKAFAKHSKYLAALSGVSMITSFVLMTGFSPSMSRAALVAGLSLLAWYFGRNFQPLVLLTVAAAVTAVVNPSFVWGDIGWYLSFASFAGIMLLAPLITHYFWGSEQLGVFRRIFIETMSAQLATLPIIAIIFGQYSPLSLPANMLVLPLIPFTMVLTFVAGIGGVIIPGLAHVVGLPANLLLQYMTTVTGWLYGMPWANGEIEFGLSLFIIGYAVLLFAGIFMWRKTRHNFGRDNIVV